LAGPESEDWLLTQSDGASHNSYIEGVVSEANDCLLQENCILWQFCHMKPSETRGIATFICEDAFHVFIDAGVTEEQLLRSCDATLAYCYRRSRLDVEES